MHAKVDGISGEAVAGVNAQGPFLLLLAKVSGPDLWSF